MTIPIAAVIVLVGIVVAISWSRSAANASVGDCLNFNQQSGNLRRVSCDGADATFRLYGITDSMAACADVLGTTQALQVGDRVYCFGEKGLDPAKAINGVKVGDCVTVSKDDAEKSGCIKGSYPVLVVLTKQLKSSTSADDLPLLCAGKPGADETTLAYGWSISTGEDQAVGTWDRVLCLGAKKS